MTYLNQFLPPEHTIIYIPWDMAKYTKRWVDSHITGGDIFLFLSCKIAADLYRKVKVTLLVSFVNLLRVCFAAGV